MTRALADVSFADEVGVERRGEVVVLGVHVPAGRLAAGAGIGFEDGEQVRPVQVLATRPAADGSVCWLVVAVQVACPASGRVAGRLVSLSDARPLPPPAGAVRVEANGARCTVRWVDAAPDLSVVDLGPGEHLVVPGPFLPDGLTVSARLDGRDCVATVDEAAIGHVGPLLVDVHLLGRYHDADGDVAGFAARVRARAGVPTLDIELSVLAHGPDPTTELGRWRIDVGTGGVEHGTVGVFARADTGRPPFAFGHGGGGHPRGIFATTGRSGGHEWRDASEPGYHDVWEWAELHGEVAQNWLVTDGVAGPRTVAVERLAEHHPAQVSCARDGVAIDLVTDAYAAGPDDGVQLARGSRPRRRIAVTAAADRRAGLRLDHPLAGFDAETLRAVRPDVLPHLPRELPNLESLIRAEMFGWYLGGQSLGFYDHGDGMQAIAGGPRLGYSSNNEHDALYSLLLHYLRSGERAYLDSAIAYGDHTVDIDVVHETPNPHELGGVRAHGKSHRHYVEARGPTGTVRTSVDTGHMWVEGLLLLSEVTGESRYGVAARGIGDCLLRLEALGWTRPEPGPRNAGWPLIALTALARADGDARYLDAAQRIADVAIGRQGADGRWTMRLGLTQDYCAWQNAVLLVGLSRLADLTEADETRVAVERGGRAMLELGRSPEGTFTYLERFDYRWPQRSGLVREALACLYESTKDTAFLTAGLAGGARWYPGQGRARVTSEDVAEWRGHLPFLGCAYRAGLLEDLP